MRAFLPESLGVAVCVSKNEMEKFGRHAVVEGRIALGLCEGFVVLPPFKKLSLDEGQWMFQAPKGLAKTDIDQPAQALLAANIDIAIEVRLEELEHPAKSH